MVFLLTPSAKTPASRQSYFQIPRQNSEGYRASGAKLSRLESHLPGLSSRARNVTTPCLLYFLKFGAQGFAVMIKLILFKS